MEITQYRFKSPYLGAAFYNELLDIGYERVGSDEVSNDCKYIIDCADGENRNKVQFLLKPIEKQDKEFFLDAEYEEARKHASKVFNGGYEKGDLVVNTDQTNGRSIVRVLDLQRNSEYFTGVLEHTTRDDDIQYIGKIYNNYPKDAFEKYQGTIEIENV